MRVLVVLLAAVLAGNARAADTVRVTIPVFSEIDYAPFYLGADKGYYAAEGLAVELVGAGGGVATPALISGDVQFSGSPSAAISAILKGAPLKIVYVMRDRPPYELWASDPAITTLADLKGKQVGVVSRGDTHENSVRLLLMAQHIDPNAVAFTALGFGNGRVAALNAGALPAASLTIEDLEQLKRTPNLHRLADTGHEVQMLVGGIAVNDRMLKADRPLGMRFMRALMKGERYMRSNEDGTIAAMLTHNGTVSRENVAKLLPRARARQFRGRHPPAGGAAADARSLCRAPRRAEGQGAADRGRVRFLAPRRGRSRARRRGLEARALSAVSLTVSAAGPRPASRRATARRLRC